MLKLLKIVCLISLFNYSFGQLGQQLNCVDKATNCADNTNLCSNTAYSDLMREMCPVTCGYCQNIGVSPLIPLFNPPLLTCYDNSANCVYWVANGFCTSAFYTYQQRVSCCQFSCGLC